MTVISEKSQLRKKFLEIRSSIEDNKRITADNKINYKLEELEDLNNGKVIAAYISDGSEVNLEQYLKSLIEVGRKICLPRFSREEGDVMYQMVYVSDIEKDLTVGKFGIPEPKAGLSVVSDKVYSEMNWLIPGVVFDVDGGRLGRGKGVYDRLLAKSNGIKIGIFYSCQQHISVPRSSHDHDLDLVITEDRVLEIFKKEKI
jgi:5-formyltetrahydrofolate cyclo-ligase